MTVSWYTDHAKPGWPSSMDLLLRWLLEPGNYERWTTSREKTKLMEDILKDMEKNGIYHRTLKSVYFQIYNLRRRFDTAKTWLEDEGQLDSFRRGEATRQVETQVRRRYPLFRDLMPLFDHDQDSTPNDDEKQQQSNYDIAEKTHFSSEKGSANLKSAGSKRKAVASISDPPKKRPLPQPRTEVQGVGGLPCCQPATLEHSRRE